MTRAYLDHASTTPPRPEALAALIRWMALPAADPGRLHQEGRTVRDALEEARQQVAWLVGATPREIVFIRQILFPLAIVAALMVLQAEMRNVIAEGEQEMVTSIMTRPKERSGFRHQARKMACSRRRYFQRRRAVGHDVQFMRRIRLGR